jgi:hypothetical protein
MQLETRRETWVSRSEAAAILQCSLTTFIGLVNEGRIRTRDFGHRRYWREDVERLAAPPPAA